MEALFEKIYNTLSMTVIQMMVDLEVADATGDDKKALERIRETRSLDEVYAIACERLGRPDEAAEIRALHDARASREPVELVESEEPLAFCF